MSPALRRSGGAGTGRPPDVGFLPVVRPPVLAMDVLMSAPVGKG